MGGNVSSVPVEPYWHTARVLNGYRNAHKNGRKTAPQCRLSTLYLSVLENDEAQMVSIF